MAITDVQDMSDRHREQKNWGWEEWVVNNKYYCGKLLYFYRDGGCTSLHFHACKHETMYVRKGSFTIELVDTSSGDMTNRHLEEGDSLVIEPLTPHRIRCTTDHSILMEFSTHHENSDSYRVAR